MLLKKSKKFSAHHTTNRLHSSNTQPIEKYNKSNTQIIRDTPQDDIFVLTHANQNDIADQAHLEATNSDQIISFKD